MSKHDHHHSTEERDGAPLVRAPKTRSEAFAEDLVYTLNHAIVCGTTDIIDPFIGNWTENYLGRRFSISGHSHDDHDHDHDHDHAHHDHHDHAHHDHHDHHDHAHHDHHDHAKPSVWGNLKHWVIGEAVGDIGAVPATLAVQYVAPGVMNGLRNLAEPVLGGLFWWAAGRNARHWGYEHGFDANSPEVNTRREEIYNHEVSHLPHAFLWTGFAAAGNVLTQKIMTPQRSAWAMVAGKANGSLLTLVTVLSMRTLAPKTVEKIDRFNSDNIAEPLTRRIGGLFGIDADTVSRVLEREREFESGEHIIKDAKKHEAPAPNASTESLDAPHKQVLATQAQLSPPSSLGHAIG